MHNPDPILHCRAAFTFTDNKLGVTATGDDFDSFKSHFGPGQITWKCFTQGGSQDMN